MDVVETDIELDISQPKRRQVGNYLKYEFFDANPGAAHCPNPLGVLVVNEIHVVSLPRQSAGVA